MRSVYNYFRIYDPELGRYLTSNLVGLAGGVNTFGYARHNPVNFIDVLGLQHGRPHGPVRNGAFSNVTMGDVARVASNVGKAATVITATCPACAPVSSLVAAAATIVEIGANTMSDIGNY